MRYPKYALLAAALLTACDLEEPTRPDAPVAAAPADPADRTPSSIALQKIATIQGGGVGAAEITAFDPVSKRLFIVNGALGTVDVADLRDPSAPVMIGSLATAGLGGAANSVAAHRGVIAVAVEGFTKTDPGTVAFFCGATLERISTVQVGALPDMVAFTPSGRSVLVANEGEPNASYTVDPEGSISIIDVHNVNQPTVRTAGFSAFNGQAAALRARGVRIFGPGASVAQDLEPEYVALSADGRPGSPSRRTTRSRSWTSRPPWSPRSSRSVSRTTACPAMRSTRVIATAG